MTQCLIDDKEITTADLIAFLQQFDPTLPVRTMDTYSRNFINLRIISQQKEDLTQPGSIGKRSRNVLYIR